MLHFGVDSFPIPPPPLFQRRRYLSLVTNFFFKEKKKTSVIEISLTVKKNSQQNVATSQNMSLVDVSKLLRKYIASLY